jgi:hypothetical protein
MDESEYAPLSSRWHAKPTKVINGKEYFCRTDSEGSDDGGATTLCTVTEGGDEDDDLLEAKERDIFSEGDGDMEMGITNGELSCGIYFESLSLGDDDVDILPEQKIALYDSVLYLIFLPVYGVDTLETSPQVLMKILQESMDVTGWVWVVFVGWGMEW